MRRFTNLPLAAFATISMSAILLVGAFRAAPTSSDAPVYSVAAVYHGLMRDAAHWQGHVVLVRGDLQIVGGGGFMPQIAVLTDPAEHLMIGKVDLMRLALVRRLLGRDDTGGTPGLYFHQAPASRQHLDLQHAATYRVRLSRMPFSGQLYAVVTAV
jgi:hypothetical protein